MRHATLAATLVALLGGGPLAAQQPLTNVRVEEATWIRDVALTRWEGERPVIYLNPRLLERFGPAMRDFFLGHEYGHVALGHRHLVPAGGAVDSAVAAAHHRMELEADCYAASRLARDTPAAAQAAIRLFARQGPRRLDRFHPTGSQRAANLLGCVNAAADSSAEPAPRPAQAGGSPTVVLARSTSSLVLGHVRVLIDGRSMGTLSTLAYAPQLALRDLAEGPHRYELRLELFAFDEAMQPNPVGFIEGRGTVEVRRGAQLEVHWLGEEPPSLLPAGTAAVAGGGGPAS